MTLPDLCEEEGIFFILHSAHPNRLLPFNPALIGLIFPLLCGIPLTLSPRIKISINLSVSLPLWMKKQRRNTTGESVAWYIASWAARQSTVGGAVSVAGLLSVWLLPPQLALTLSLFLSVSYESP